MDPEVKAAWVADLRSGQSQQGYGMLQTAEGTFCCLGRLCELAVSAGTIPPPTWEPDFDEDDQELEGEGSWWYDNAAVALPPTTVYNWAGISTSDPNALTVIYQGERQELTVLNDTFQLSFAEIADLVEEQM